MTYSTSIRFVPPSQAKIFVPFPLQTKAQSRDEICHAVSQWRGDGVHCGMMHWRLNLKISAEGYVYHPYPKYEKILVPRTRPQLQDTTVQREKREHRSDIFLYRPFPVNIIENLQDHPEEIDKEMDRISYEAAHNADFRFHLARWYCETHPSLRGKDRKIRRAIQAVYGMIRVSEMTRDDALWFYGDAIKTDRNWISLHFGFCEAKDLKAPCRYDMGLCLRQGCKTEALALLESKNTDIKVLIDETIDTVVLEFIFENADMSPILPKIDVGEAKIVLLPFLARAGIDITSRFGEHTLEEDLRIVKKILPHVGIKKKMELLKGILDALAREYESEIFDGMSLIAARATIADTFAGKLEIADTRKRYEERDINSYLTCSNVGELMERALEAGDRMLLAVAIGSYSPETLSTL